MGYRTYERNEGLVGKVDGNETGGQQRKTTGNQSTADTKSNDTGRKSRGRGNGKTGTDTEEKEVNSELAIIEAEVAEAKPKRAQRKKKESKEVIGEKEFTAVLQSITMVAASRPGMEYWALSEKEAESIAIPLARMIAKNENAKALLTHSDAIALLAACITVMLPRVMIATQRSKERKVKKNERKFAVTGGGKIKTVEQNRENRSDNQSTGVAESGQPTSVYTANGGYDDAITQQIC